jgi:hypothetical protein
MDEAEAAMPEYRDLLQKELAEKENLTRPKS